MICDRAICKPELYSTSKKLREMISFYFVCIFFHHIVKEYTRREKLRIFARLFYFLVFYILGYIFRNYIIWNLLLRCIRYFNLIFIYYLLSHTYLYNYRGIVSYSNYRRKYQKNAFMFFKSVLFRDVFAFQ